MGFLDVEDNEEVQKQQNELMVEDNEEVQKQPNELMVRVESLDYKLKEIEETIQELEKRFRYMYFDLKDREYEIADTITKVNANTTDNLETKLKQLKESIDSLATKSDDLGEVQESIRSLKGEIIGIDKKFARIEAPIASNEKETKSQEEVVKIAKRCEMVEKKIQGLKIDSLTEQFNSFLARKEKFDHEGDEKFRTFFQGFTVDTAILSCCTLARSSPDLAQFHPLLLALTIVTSVIFLALSANLCLSIWDFRSYAENLRTERAALETAFQKEVEGEGDPEGAERDPDAVARAKIKMECLQNTHINFKPLAVVGGFILVATIAFLVTQIILLLNVFQTKTKPS